MVPPEILEDAVNKRKEYLEKLEKLTKRYSPDLFILNAARYLHKFQRLNPGINGRAGMPDYVVAEMIEANCAYFRGNRTAIPEEKYLHEIRNHIVSFSDPGQIYALQTDGFNKFLISASRQQFYTQKDINRQSVSRYYRMYCMSCHKESINTFFADRGRLDIDSFLASSLLVHSNTLKHLETGQFSGVSIQDLTHDKIRVDSAKLQLFFYETCQTPREIGIRYKKKREYIPGSRKNHPITHATIPSYFREKPGIIHPATDSQAIYPFPGAFNHHLHIRNHAILKEEIDGSRLSGINGVILENYIYHILLKWAGNTNKISRPDKENRRDKRCDFIVELDNVIIAIESKSISLTHNLPSDENLIKDTSSQEIASAMDQITATIGAIKTDKPFFGIIVTHEEVELSGDSEYYKKYIEPNRTSNFSDASVDKRIFTLSIFGLEALLCLKNEAEISQTLNLYMEEKYGLKGSLDAYLTRKSIDEAWGWVDRIGAQEDFGEAFRLVITQEDMETAEDK